jgi:hypothetical protein
VFGVYLNVGKTLQKDESNWPNGGLTDLPIDPNMFYFDHTQRNIKRSALNHRIYVGLIKSYGETHMALRAHQIEVNEHRMAQQTHKNASKAFILNLNDLSRLLI